MTAVRKEGLVSAVSRTASYCARRGMLVLASSLDSGDPLSEHPQARTLLIESCVNPSSDRRCPSDAWGLGDAIFRLPAVEALRRTGGRHVDVVTAHGREAVFRRSPDVGTVMTPADGWLSLARRIRRGGYTHVFAMHPSWRMLLLGLIA